MGGTVAGAVDGDRAGDTDAGSGDALVVAYGGDGFIGLIAHAVRDSGALFLPLSGGRGNDIVRWFGLDGAPERIIAVLPETGVWADGEFVGPLPATVEVEPGAASLRMLVR
ncbi:hypothetical protein GCM10009755_21630 [Brevibacterium samyangense]|uniref:DAGKc domain-containing protein n=1 Tax=Brevibacterium samyangense TaxID=366888 RepID=A0ABN2TJ33_9MICO